MECSIVKITFDSFHLNSTAVINIFKLIKIKMDNVSDEKFISH